MPSLELKVIPPFQVIILGFASWWLHGHTDFGHVHFGFEYVLSRVLLLLALAIAAGSIYQFWRHQTTVNPTRLSQTNSLITGGLFALSRNPIYVADALVLVAWSIYLGFWPALVTVPVFMAYVTRFQIIPEERVLAEKFGDAYSEYCERVRRWI